MTRPFVIVVATDVGFRSWCRGALVRAGYRVAAPATAQAAEYFIASAYPPDVVVFREHERWPETLAEIIRRAPRAPGVAVVAGPPEETGGGASAVLEAVARAVVRITSEPVEWRDELLLGVVRLDAPHRALVALLSALERAVRSGRRQEAMDGLARLRAHTETHFVDEESLMKLHGFGDRAVHTREHAMLLEELGELALRCARDERPAAPALVLSLRDWLEGHIMTLDRALARHLGGVPASSDGGTHGGAS